MLYSVGIEEAIDEYVIQDAENYETLNRFIDFATEKGLIVYSVSCKELDPNEWADFDDKFE